MAEMVAILKSLQYILEKSHTKTSWVILSDSLSSIQSLQSDIDTSPIHQDIQYCFYQLWRQCINVTISWIPSHVGIRGNEIVDKLAKKALSHELIDCPVLQDLSYLYSVLRDNFLVEWQNRWNSGKTGRFYFVIQPSVSEEVKYTDSNRHKQTSITRLRFGKCLLGDVLHMTGRRDDDLCDFCNVREDVEHFLLDCNDFHDFQIEFNDKLLSGKSVPTLKNILGNKRWFTDLWIYIQQTKKSL